MTAIAAPELAVSSDSGGSSARRRGTNRGAFQALMRDMEQDFWRNQPHDSAEFDSTRRVGPVDAAPVPAAAGHAQPCDPDTASQPSPTAPPSTVKMLELASLAARRGQPDPDTTARDKAVEGAVTSQSFIEIVAIAPETPEASADLRRRRIERQQPPSSDAAEQIYQTVKLHIYRTATGLGISYRDASCDSQVTDKALELRKRLRAAGMKQVTEVFVNATRVEFGGN